MALFGAAQSGGNIVAGLNMTDLRSGDSLQLMKGTETVATGTASVAFSAGVRPGGVVASSYYVTGCANGTQWSIQGSNGPATEDVAGSPTSTLNNFAATFQDLAGSVTTGNGSFPEVSGASLYYRFYVKTFVAGDAPVVWVNRS